MISAIILAVIVLIISIWLRRSKGRIGEHRVAHILSKLPKDRYQVINNLLLRTSSDSTTQIDHVVISQYGIFVIETKFYKGWIYGGENSEYWTQNIYGHKYSLRNPIHQNQGHIRALKHLLKDFGDIPFISIVAFSRQCRLGVNASTPVIYWNQIPRIINQFRDKHLNPTPKLSASTTISLNPTATLKSHAKSTSAMSAPTSNGATPPSPPANAPVAAATSSFATVPTALSTAAPTTPAADLP
jgi:hypothetical protein